MEIRLIGSDEVSRSDARSAKPHGLSELIGDNAAAGGDLVDWCGNVPGLVATHENDRASCLSARDVEHGASGFEMVNCVPDSSW